MDASLRYLAHRLVFAVVAVWAVVTFVFLFVSLTPDTYLAELLYYETRQTRGNATAAVTQLEHSYRAARGLHRPLWDRYVDWLVGVAAFDWGRSFQTGAPVSQMVRAYSLRSAMYVLPAIVVSSVGGAFIGLYSAANRNSVLDRITSLLASVGIGIPNFWLAGIAIIFVQGEGMNVIQVFLNDRQVALEQYVLPAAVLSTVLLGNQIHYARAEIHEHLKANFVDVLRAKGVTDLRVARHVLRNAALPLFSVLFADLLAVLMLHVFVIETVFGIPGLGRLTLLAVDTRDLPLVMGVTMVVVFVGIFGTLLQDLLSFVLDPRVRTDSE